MHAKSLFHRIQTTDSQYREATLDDLLYQVSQNLETLLNSKQGSALIDTSYGLPDFNGVTHNIREVIPYLEHQITSILQKFETRIHVNHVSGQIDTQAYPGQIVFNVNAYVEYAQEKHYIEYQTIMTGTGKILVRRQ